MRGYNGRYGQTMCLQCTKKKTAYNAPFVVHCDRMKNFLCGAVHTTAAQCNIHRHTYIPTH